MKTLQIGKKTYELIEVAGQDCPPAETDKMTLLDFIHNVNDGIFTNVNGKGVYGTRHGPSKIPIDIFDVKADLIDYGFSHVYWTPTNYGHPVESGFQGGRYRPKPDIPTLIETVDASSPVQDSLSLNLRNGDSHA